MLFSLYIASVCLTLATHIVVALAFGEKGKPKKASFWEILITLLACFIPGINVMYAYQLVKGVVTTKFGKKETKTETTTKEEKVETKSEEKSEEKAVSLEKEVEKESDKERVVTPSPIRVYDELSRDEKIAYLERARDFLIRQRESAKESSGPVLKKKLEPSRS